MRLIELQKLPVGKGVSYDPGRKKIYFDKDAALSLKTLQRLRRLRQKEATRRLQKMQLISLMYGPRDEHRQ